MEPEVPAVAPSTSTADPPAVRTGQKRPAPSGVTEPADKKSRTVTKKPTAPDFHRSEPGGILNLIVNRFLSPFPIHDAIYIVMNSAGLANWFASIRDSLLESIYPDSNYVEEHVITQEQFVLVCRYLTKARVDHVYASYSGRRPAGRIAIPREFELPKSPSDIIGSIGTSLVQGGSFLICPEPEAAPADNAAALHNAVTYAMLSSFSRLVQAAKVRNIIRTSVMPAAIEGTPWWALSARTANQPQIIADNADSVQVFGIFKEWTPADGVMYAIAQNGYLGIFGGDTQMKWSMDYITGIAGLRRSYNLDA